jgi:hypothetical protein
MAQLERFLKGVGAKRRWESGFFKIDTLGPVPNGEFFFDETDADTQYFLDSITQAIGSAFGKPPSDTPGHIRKATALSILHDTQKVCGFASVRYPQRDSLYLHGMAIAKEAQGRGMAIKLLRPHLEDSRISHIMFSTQNPTMYCFLESITKKVYPNLNERELPEDLREIAASFMDGRCAHFDSCASIATGLYQSPLYEERDRSNREDVNLWFSDALGFERGETLNAFLFFGRHIDLSVLYGHR